MPKPISVLSLHIYSLRASLWWKGVSHNVNTNFLNEIFPHKIWNVHETLIIVVAVHRECTSNIGRLFENKTFSRIKFELFVYDDIS